MNEFWVVGSGFWVLGSRYNTFISILAYYLISTLAHQHISTSSHHHIIPNANELQAQAKWNNDSVKITIMNQLIQENMYWRAGRTTPASYSFIYK
jgi:hypothetical protein